MGNASQQRSRLKVQEAVRAAIKHLPEFLDRADRPLEGVRVEEVFPPGEGTSWRITLSHLEPGVEKPKHPAMRVLEGPLKAPPPPERVYHVLEVDAETGDVLSMRLREEP